MDRGHSGAGPPNGESMNCQTILSCLIALLTSWQGVVLILGLVFILVFRRPLSGLLPSLRTLEIAKDKGLTLDVEKNIEALAVDAKKELPAEAGAATTTQRLKSRLIRMAEESPRNGILESWLEREEAAIKASKRHGVGLKSREAKSAELEEALKGAGILTEKKRKIFRELRLLRNAAAHAKNFKVDPKSVSKYRSEEHTS